MMLCVDFVSHPVYCSITVGVNLHEHDGHLLLVLSLPQDLTKRCFELIYVKTIAAILISFLRTINYMPDISSIDIMQIADKAHCYHFRT